MSIDNVERGRAERRRGWADQYQYYFALACGVFPLTVGSLIYFAWRITRWDWLPAAGLITVFVGFAFFCVGLISLALFTYRRYRRGDSPAGRLEVQAILGLAALLINFPVAAIYAHSAIRLMTQYYLNVVNESKAPIDRFVLHGPNVNFDLAPIPAGGHVIRSFRFRGDGTLTFEASQQQHSFRGEIEGYVTGSMGGSTTLTIRPDRTVSIRRDPLFAD